MSVTANGYEARVSSALVQQLADAGTFQTLVEAGTNSVAKDYMVEGDGGEQALSVTQQQIDINGSWGIVRLGTTERVERAFQSWGRQGDASVVLIIRPETNDTAVEALRRARNITGLIADEMQDQIGASADRIAWAAFNVGEIVLSDETGALANSYLCHIDITWKGYSVSQAFNFNAIRLNDAVNFLTGIRNPSFQHREQRAPIGTDGTLFETSNAVIRTAPMATFETIAVRTLISLLNDSANLPMKTFDGANGLQMMLLQAAANTPGYETDPLHGFRQMKNGAIYLSGLSYSPGDVLVASLDAFGLSQNQDGVTDPVEYGTTEAFPTLPVNKEQLVMSSLVIGGLTITNLKSWDLTIGHKAENNDPNISYSTGLPYPILMALAGASGQAEISMSCETLDSTSAITTSGTGVAVFKKVNHLGVGLTSQTTTVTVRSALIREESIDGTPAGRRIIVDATFNGTNLPLAIVNA